MPVASLRAEDTAYPSEDKTAETVVHLMVRTMLFTLSAATRTACSARCSAAGCAWFPTKGGHPLVRLATGPRGDELLPTAEEAERAAKEAERAAKEQERTRRIALEAEVEALRRRLSGRGPESGE